MKFLNNQALHSKNVKIEDYIDSKIIHALPPHHQQILNKLINLREKILKSQFSQVLFIFNK